MVKYLIAFLFLFTYQFTFAQVNAPHTSSDIFQQIKKLKVLASVLYVGAHPDDENNALLPFLAKDRLYRTAYLSLTRGDGGQNLIGNEQGVELGLIRTQELLAARKIDGAEQYFTRAYEFGYSKSAEEALRIWDREKILSDVVWVIRKLQPDVIIKRFPGDKRAGHGHHAASALLADEAFKAAADPSRFPEQFKYGVKPWRAKRILWNTYRFGSFNTTSEDQLKIDIGAYNPLLGLSYGELGGIARTMHKSQGEGRPQRKGSSVEYFLNTDGAPPSNDLMDGVDTTWARIPGGEAISASIDNILNNYKIDDPSQSVRDLISLYTAIDKLPKTIWVEEKKVELGQIILECSGLYIESTCDQQHVVQGDSLKVNFFVNKREKVDADLQSVSLRSFDTTLQTKLPLNENVEFQTSIRVPEDEPISQPYWLEKPLEGGYFEVDDQTMIGKAENDPPFIAIFRITVDRQEFKVTRPVQYRYIDAVKGDTYQPIAVLPAIEVRYAKDNYLSLNGKPVSVETNIKSNDGKQVAGAILTQQLTSDWDIKENMMQHAAMPITEKNVFSTLTPQSPELNTSDELRGAAMFSKKLFNHYTRTISYDHIPAITWFPYATANVLRLDIKTTGKNIGYFTGAGDKVPEALEGMGYRVTFLTEADLNPRRLQQFDAIFTGVRAYNINSFLTDRNDVMNEYVKNGGNLIVEYLKSNTVGQQEVRVGPYPFQVSSGSRITEEDAKVNFILPHHPVLNFPNKITDNDFQGWIQERSTYQAINYDEHFETPLGMKDTGEEESKGSLAIAKYGKGNFVYTGLVFFRELPAGVPGAYRLLANIIALPKNDK